MKLFNFFFYPAYLNWFKAIFFTKNYFILLKEKAIECRGRPDVWIFMFGLLLFIIFDYSVRTIPYIFYPFLGGSIFIFLSFMYFTIKSFVPIIQKQWISQRMVIQQKWLVLSNQHKINPQLSKKRVL